MGTAGIHIRVLEELTNDANAALHQFWNVIKTAEVPHNWKNTNSLHPWRCSELTEHGSEQLDLFYAGDGTIWILEVPPNLSYDFGILIVLLRLWGKNYNYSYTDYHTDVNVSNQR